MSAVQVEIRRRGDRYELLRGGEPYFIRGAAGDANLDLLVAAGGNSIRTWRAQGLRPLLDQAYEHGLTVTVGLWLEHERHGFNYDDEAAVRAQFETCRQYVDELKDHPAILFWGVANEVENACKSSRVWTAINDVAAMIHELDPLHPVLTVTADINQEKVDNLIAHCPALDLLGVNSYGGLGTVAQRLEGHGWKKPFIVTEFGPVGWWEGPKTEWGAELEATSSEKERVYIENYRRAVTENPGWCLGSYVFFWDHKQEHTSTWFGMFLPDGRRVNTVDAMTYSWTGQWPAVRCPTIHALESDARERRVKPGEIHTATLEAAPQNGSPLNYHWEVVAESHDKKEGGDEEAVPPSLDDAIVKIDGPRITFRAPSRPGGYRLMAYAYGEENTAATANFPFLVEE
jgi:hypothetical protein